MTAAPKVARLLAEHWPEVAAIYEAGIATGNATFETSAPTWRAWDAAHRPDLRLVTLDDDEVIGWAAAGNVSERCCYSGVIEHSVYVAPDHQGHRVGRALLKALIARRRSSRCLDHADRHLSREHCQHCASSTVWVSRCWHP